MNNEQPQSLLNDCLGFTAGAPGGKAVLVFDTEQSDYDFHRGMNRALQRSGVEQCPPWLHAYPVAGWTPQALRQVIQAACAREAEKNGIHTVIIDGIGDFVSDVNEAGESNEVVTEMHEIAIKYDCSVILVIHENPPSAAAGKTGLKSRGHLGSQLARKSETVLTLAKQGDVTVAYAVITRGAPVPEQFGPRFQWSEAAGGHVTTVSQFASKAEEKVQELRDLAIAAFGDQPGLKYAALKAAIVDVEGGEGKTAEKRITEMKKAGVIHLSGGTKIYVVSPA